MKKQRYYAWLIHILLLLVVKNPLFAQNENPKNGDLVTETKTSAKLGGWIDDQYRIEQDAGMQNSIVQIRRARFDYRGSLSKIADFRFQVDFAPNPRLIDAYAKLNFSNYLQLQVGQFKIPFSLENKLSPLDLELIDNAQIISALAGYKDVTVIANYANGREIGAMVTGKLVYTTIGDEKIALVSYGLGLFGGNGINVKTDNLAKDVAARIEFCPFIRNMTLSVSGYWGTYEMLYANSPTGMNGTRDRYALGLQYADNHWMVRAEYLKGKTGFVSYNESDDMFTPYNVETQGCYLTTRYWFFFNNRRAGAFRQKVSPVIRVEYYEKNMTDNASSMFYSTGVDWWMDEHLRFQLAYTVQQKQLSTQLGHTLTTMITAKF